MATLYIEEFETGGAIGIGTVLQAGLQPSLARQTVTIDVASAQSSAFSARTKFVRLHTDAICSVLFGVNPTAEAAHSRLAANQTEYFSVKPGDKVAVIVNT